MVNYTFDAVKEVPDLAGKVILITGATAGLGYESALVLADHGPAHIYFTGRSQSSADKLINQVHSTHPSTPITFIPCDMTDLNAVRTAAQTLLSQTSRLDILLANAGIMCVPFNQTKQNYEIQFGVNYLAHALLVKLLLPTLESTAKLTSSPPRIVFLTSLGYTLHPSQGILFDRLSTSLSNLSWNAWWGKWSLYGQAKLANLLYARQIAQHYPSLTCVSVHPGVAATSLFRDLGAFNTAFIYTMSYSQLTTPEKCAYNQLWAATAPLGKGERQVESGVFYEPVGLKGELQKSSGDDELGRKLWDWTQKESEGYSL